MLNQTEIFAILEKALIETQRGGANKHAFSPTLPITGKDSIFDSLDTMLFLDSVDDLLTKQMGRTITLVTDDVFSLEETPFKTMQTLAVYIEELVKEA